MEKDLGQKNSSDEKTKNIDQTNLTNQIESLTEKVKLYENEETKSARKISDLEEELSELRKRELDQITDEFSMG